MSRRSRYTISSANNLSIISLGANTCSVVELFLHVAWDMGTAESKIKLILVHYTGC